MLTEVFFSGNDAKKRKQCKNENGFASSYPNGAWIPGTAGGGALEKLDGAPEYEKQRPPMPEEIKNVEASVLGEEQHNSDRDEGKSGKDGISL